MRKILVTAIGGNVGNGILKILSRGEDEIYGCDINDYPIGLDKVKKFWKSDSAVSSKYVENLLEKCKENKISHIIPVNEVEIAIINRNRQIFYDNEIRLLIQDNEVVNICLDKLETMNLLNEYIKENVTKTYTFENFEENNQTFIIKLRNSYGSKFLKCFKHRKEIDDLMLEKDKYIIQEYLSDESEEYTIGVFSDGNIVRSIIFKRKLEHGYTSFVELIENQKLHDLAIKVCSILNIRGSINIQLRKDNDNYKIFEINPRLSGTVYFRHILGFDDVLWWLALLDKNNIPEYKNTYKRAIGVRELNEKFLVLQD